MARAQTDASQTRESRYATSTRQMHQCMYALALITVQGPLPLPPQPLPSCPLRLFCHRHLRGKRLA
eukprot:15471432-Alexandrium_andersonii.AAC.1